MGEAATAEDIQEAEVEVDTQEVTGQRREAAIAEDTLAPLKVGQVDTEAALEAPLKHGHTTDISSTTAEVDGNLCIDGLQRRNQVDRYLKDMRFTIKTEIN